MTKFEVGDVVRSASGGAEMVVDSDGTSPGEVWCVWFDSDGKKHDDAFDEGVLVKMKDRN